jgi:hypothetical protein
MITQAATTKTAQIGIALEVLKMDETGKTKNQISKDFGVSPRSVARYSEKFENEAMDLLTSEPEESKELRESFKPDEIATPATETEETDSEEEVVDQATPKKKRTKKDRETNGLTAGQNKLLTNFQKQKLEMVNFEERQNKTGRARKGVKTIRFITMELMEEYKAGGELTSKNKDAIINHIAQNANVSLKTSKQYFSTHKILFGGFTD